MSKPPLWFDHENNQSQWLAALDRVRRLSTRGAEVGPHSKALGSLILIERIREAIDDYAERETGNREFLLGHSAQHATRVSAIACASNSSITD
jgi:hypothetical protein